MTVFGKATISGGRVEVPSEPAEMLSCRDAKMPCVKQFLDAPSKSEVTTPERSKFEGPKILVVVAHPDDEQYAASTLYKLTSEMKAKVDLVVATNGEGGYPYSGPAEKIYGVALASKDAAAENLAKVRKEELKEAGKVLGISEITMLDQPDPRKATPQETKDEKLITEGGEWNRGFVRSVIDEKLRSDKYDYVITLLPTVDEHRAHKAATITALEAVNALPEGERPVVLGARLSKEVEPCLSTQPELSSNPAIKVDPASPTLDFDRQQRFGVNNKMSYQMPAVWEMTSHKSQGAAQELAWTMHSENFQILGNPTEAKKQEAIGLFKRLNNQGE